MKKNDSKNLELFNNEIIFVFGSNEAGRHWAGAALTAQKRFGAKFGQGFGLQGSSFAIPTKDQSILTLPLNIIQQYVERFKDFAQINSQLKFFVTRIGTGLAGMKDKDIAPMFKGAPTNCEFDILWKPFLGEEYAYFTKPL